MPLTKSLSFQSVTELAAARTKPHDTGLKQSKITWTDISLRCMRKWRELGQKNRDCFQLSLIPVIFGCSRRAVPGGPSGLQRRFGL